VCVYELGVSRVGSLLYLVVELMCQGSSLAFSSPHVQDALSMFKVNELGRYAHSPRHIHQGISTDHVNYSMTNHKVDLILPSMATAGRRVIRAPSFRYLSHSTLSAIGAALYITGASYH